MIEAGIGLALVALSTLSTALVVGLAFLPHPTRASATWTLAFATGMVGAYAWVASDVLDSLTLRATGVGIVLGVMPLLWIGLRLHRGARSLWWVAAGCATAIAGVLVATAETALYPLMFRSAFAAAAAFAALIGLELFRLHDVARDAVLPLGLASGVYVAFALVSVVDGLITVGLPRDDGLSLVRDINTIGGLVYAQCATITVILLARLHSPARPAAGASSFRATAQARLHRALSLGDTAWSILDIRLDDPEDVRAASNVSTFAAAAARFADDIQSVLPAEADIDRIDDSRLIVLTPGADAVVRERLQTALNRVAAIHDEQPITVRLSASIGWAGAAHIGFDLDELLAAAGAAATRAYEKGGDCWERATAASSAAADPPAADAAP